MNKRIYIYISLIALAIAGFAFWPQAQDQMTTTPTASTTGADGAPMVAVKTVELSGNEVLGETAFNAKCAACHGANGAGTEGKAPPLVHKIYEPGHHGDAAFLVAVKNGVRPHHWPFGDMPPVEGLTDSDVANIVAYVRALQRANGID